MRKQPDYKIDFLSKRMIAGVLSGLLILTSIVSLSSQGLKKGIDFTGGTIVEIGFQESAELTSLRRILDQAGFGGAIVQHFGSSKEVLIRLLPDDSVNTAALSNKVIDAVNANYELQGELRRAEFVGPQVGEELTEDGGLALLYALFGILIYVTVRFKYHFAVGAVAALAHDVLIILGVFSVFQFEFDLTVLAALLAVIGYSLNDTIVVFDRVRENFRKLRKGTSVDIVNISLNQTLSRTIMTSITTLIVLVALFVLGGEIIHDFAFALILGVFVGTYSSIYVASPITLLLGISKEAMTVVKVNNEELDKIP
jgi:preprotein translocase subunit SecF